MIIHSPVISGSLTFAEGATFTLPDNGIYSGSFSGSFQGDGSSLTFGGTNIVSSSQQLSLEFLDTLGDGVVSQSSQIVFNDVFNNPFSSSNDVTFTSTHIVPDSLELDLGSSTAPFRDLYLSSASLYINGQQIISSTNDDLSITTDANQSLRIVETGADTITLQTENGDITITSTGNGNIEFDAPIQIGAGNQILSSDGNAIQFGEDISVSGNISISGTVDGVDVAQLKADFDTLDGTTLISSSAQVSITESQISDLGSYVATNSVQALNNGTALSLSTNTLTLTKADGTTDTVDLSSYLDEDARAIDSGVLNGATGIVTFTRDDSTTFTLDLSDLLDDTNLVTSVAGKNGVVTLDTDDVSEATNLYYTDARVKTKLNAEAVVSGSTQVSFNDISSNPFENGGSNDITASGHIVPSTTLTYDLGSSDLRWRDLYLSGSTIDLGGTLITRDSSGDINFLDSDTRNLKKIVIEELQIGTGASARKVKVDDGKIKFFDNTDTEDKDSVQLSSLSIPGLGDLPGSGDDLATRVSTLEGTDIQITLTGDVSGTGVISNLGDVSFSTTIADDSHNHTIANVDGLQSALNLKAPLASPSLTGTPTAPTATTTTNNTQIATTAFVQGRIDEVIGTAGSTLDTLGELSASLAEDSGSLASLVTTVGGKLAKSSNLSDLTDSDAALSNLGLTATATELNYVDGVTSNIQTQLNGKAASSHTHTASEITDFDTEVSNNSAVSANTAKVGYTDALVKAKMNADTIISGSDQVDYNSILNKPSIPSTEDIEDIAGAMFTGNTESGIIVTYDDASAKINLTVATQSDENFTSALKSKLDAIEAGATADQTSEEIEDIVGAMVAGNSESGIAVTYDDTNGKLNFSVTSQTDNNFTNTLKGKLDGIAENANNYSLPTATSSVLGGVKIGSGISISSGVISADSQTDNNFTNALKSKLDGIEALADVTDSDNVNAAGAVMNSDTSTAAMSFVIDEDNMASNTATKVPTQQSVKAYVDNEISDLIGGAPGALDTLNELAAAINDDNSFASTITTELATKANKSITLTAGNGLTGGGDLSANRTFSMSGNYTGTFAVTGGITATADVVAYASSDKRLKDNIQNIENPIGKVQQLNGVTWDWNDNADELQKSTPNVGVIAQEVEEVLPQLVNTRDNGYKAVDYAKLTGLLIEAIKDQQKQIDDLKSRLQ